MKKIVFRVDSGNHIGMGHLMRCLTLANELQKHNFEVHFITKDHSGFVSELISGKFHTKIISGGVKTALSSEEKKDYSNWLGQTEEEDLLQTNQYLNEISGADLFIIDHYSLDIRYEEKVQAQHVMIIDDLWNRKHVCDLLLDQNIAARKENYKNLMSREPRYLMGPQFALLRNEFRKLKQLVDQSLFNRDVKNILVFFGGADEQGYTYKFASAIDPDYFNKFTFTFVLNETHADYKSLKKIQLKYPAIKLLSFVDDFAGLMLNSDLFIGAGGTTSWERACLGIASALVAVAENQIENCRQLQQSHNAYYLGRADEMTPAQWNSFFNKIVPDSGLWYVCREKSFMLVDGLGASRVVDEIKKVVLC